jgi:hypothetical protein
MAMTQAQLRARVRDLVAAGDLPNEPPFVRNAGPGFRGFRRGAPCLICGEPGATTAYVWTGGRGGTPSCGLRRYLETGTRSLGRVSTVNDAKTIELNIPSELAIHNSPGGRLSRLGPPTQQIARRARACREERRVIRELNFGRHQGQAERPDSIRCKLPE